MNLPKAQQPVLQSASQDMEPCAKKPDGFMTFYFPGLIYAFAVMNVSKAGVDEQKKIDAHRVSNVPSSVEKPIKALE